MLRSVFSVLAPHFCLCCNREGTLLCAECSLRYLPALSSLCAGCLRPTLGFKICEKCQFRIGVIRVWPATRYDDVAQQLVRAMKFNQSRDASLDMARVLHDRLPMLPANTAIVPIPTAAARVRQRGFDHAKLIAKELARLRTLPYNDWLRRFGKTRQVGARRDVRAEQLRDVFWTSVDLTPHTPILLIDDVFTTGATIGAAARTLRSSGATRIYAATFALTL